MLFSVHVLGDSRMTVARTQLIEPRAREELYTEQFDPWTEHIAPLFKDNEICLEFIATYSGGVTTSDIEGLERKQCSNYRDGSLLKRKFS